jgi:hypothetical protein
MEPVQSEAEMPEPSAKGDSSKAPSPVSYDY